MGAIRRLVALGADPSGRTTFGGPEHGEGTTPLHLAAQNGGLDAIEALLDLGADPTLREAREHGDGAGGAARPARAADAVDGVVRRGVEGVQLRAPSKLTSEPVGPTAISVAREPETQSTPER